MFSKCFLQNLIAELFTQVELSSDQMPKRENKNGFKMHMFLQATQVIQNSSSDVVK